MMTISPLVSVVVTGRNESMTIEDCINSIFRQDYCNFEIIFIDGKSTDCTYEKVLTLQEQSRSYANCKRFVCLSVDADSPAKGRNYGAALASGDIIAFTDADCMAERQWLSNLVLHAKNSNIVGGPNILKHRTTSIFVNAIDAALSTRLGNGGSAQFMRIANLKQVKAIPACNLALSKKMFDELQGFNETLKYNEDSDLCYRARKKGSIIIYNPHAVVNHFMGLDNFSAFTKFIYKYGLERGKNARRFSHLLQGINLIGMFFIPFLCLLGVISLYIEALRLPLVQVIIGVIILLAAYSIKAAIIGRSVLLIPIAFLTFASIHFVYNVGLMTGIIRGKAC